MNGKYYIYKHYTKDDNKLFYIGLGRNKRAFQVSGRSDFWTNVYSKHGRIVEICSNYLTLSEAKLIERKLIKKYGKLCDNTGILVNFSDGGDSAWNTNIEKEKQPRFGHKNSDKQKQIISDYMKNNNPMKNETSIEKMKNSKIGKKWDKNRFREIEVYKNDILIGVYNGTKDLSEKLNLKYGSVASCLNGVRNSVYGYILKYKNNLNN